MSVDKINAADQQARVLAQKKQELEREENSLEIARAQAERERKKINAAEKEKNDKEMVAISKLGQQQAETVKKMNSDRVRQLNDLSQKHYEKLSLETADRIKALEGEAIKAVEDRKAGTMERIRNVTERAEDPFYRLRSFNPVMSESDKDFKIKISLPEHEAQNLFVTGEGHAVKLSLARRFQDKVQDKETGRSTKTSSYQTVVEHLQMTAPFDPKGIKKEYADGIVTVTVPKLSMIPPLEE